jgi:chromosome condensin MukBEF complex kleisin-like MukF subunit
MDNFESELEKAESFDELAKVVKKLSSKFQHEIGQLRKNLRERVKDSNVEIDKQNTGLNEKIAGMTAEIARARERATKTTDSEASKALRESAQTLEETVDTLKKNLSNLKNVTKIVNDLDSMAVQMVIAPVDRLMKKLRQPLVLQVIMDTIWGLLLLTLVVNTLVDKISSKAMSLYLIPTCLFFLQKYFLDRWFARIMLNRHKTALRKIIENADFVLKKAEYFDA